MLLSVPLREVIAFALEEYVCNESCSSRFHFANKLCKHNPEHPPCASALCSFSALLSQKRFCTVKMCLSKCVPLLTITPVVFRRFTVSPAQSLSTWTSKCASLFTCAGCCCAFLGAPFKYPTTRDIVDSLGVRCPCVSRSRYMRENQRVRARLGSFSSGVPDQRRLKVVAEGLPLFHGAQLAADTTLVSPLRWRAPHIQCGRATGPQAEGAHISCAQWGSRAKLVVLAAEGGGRW